MQQMLAVKTDGRISRYLTIDVDRDYEPAQPGEVVELVTFPEEWS